MPRRFLVCLLLFAVLVWRGLRIGLRAAEPFGAYLALGITVLLGHPDARGLVRRSRS